MSEAVALLAATAAAFTGLVFVRAAWHKLSDFSRATGFVSDYRLLPEPFVRPASAVAVAAEAAVPVLLLIPATAIAGAILAILLLALYAAAIVINIARGRTSIDCGCGGAPILLTPALFIRNGVLALIAAAPLFGGGAPLSFGEGAMVAALALLLFVSYLLVEQLLANAAYARRLGTRRVEGREQ